MHCCCSSSLLSSLSSKRSILFYFSAQHHLFHSFILNSWPMRVIETSDPLPLYLVIHQFDSFRQRSATSVHCLGRLLYGRLLSAIPKDILRCQWSRTVAQGPETVMMMICVGPCLGSDVWTCTEACEGVECTTGGCRYNSKGLRDCKGSCYWCGCHMHRHFRYHASYLSRLG